MSTKISRKKNLAIGAGSFKAMGGAVKAAGLVETLSGKGPFSEIMKDLAVVPEGFSHNLVTLNLKETKRNRLTP